MRPGLLTVTAACLLAGCAGRAEVAEWSATFAETGGRVASFEERDAFGRVLEGDDDATAQWERYEQFPEAYRSAECRDGGRLDLDKRSTELP